ncbi:MAG: response regulator [Candidatus Omnitrophica bacterium]|nr:response regulator [Candidatus Omnitrophota bacterium]
MTCRTVLIVDDDPIVLKIVHIRLSRKGNLRILTAETGKAGLALVEKEKPDILVLDHLLPDTDGLTLCKTIKANPLLQEIPILFFSSFSEFGFAHSVEAAGAIRVIPKAEMTELVMAVQKLVEQADKAKAAQ